MVGTLGACGTRAGLEAASATMSPLAISGRAVTASTKAICTSLVISACTAGAPPR